MMNFTYLEENLVCLLEQLGTKMTNSVFFKIPAEKGGGPKIPKGNDAFYYTVRSGQIFQDHD